MRQAIHRYLVLFVIALCSIMFSGISQVSAHCDTMDGPVIVDAKEALETGKVDLVLAWVQKEDEPEIKEAFAKTLAVRKLSPDAKEMADMYFFETLVRVHRAGEGAPYTGVKPAGAETDPAIVAADKVLEKGSIDNLVKHMNEAVATGIQARYQNAVEKKKHARESVAAGREYVAAYVEFIHYVEKLHQVAAGSGASHDHKAAKAAEHDHKAPGAALHYHKAAGKAAHDHQ